MKTARKEIRLEKGAIMNKIGEDFDFQEIYENAVRLREMAQAWNEIILRLDNLRPVRHAHLIKLYYYKGQNHYDENFEGWTASARKGFDDVPKVKGTNKYPGFNKLYDHVWESVEDSFDDFHRRTVSDLNKAYTDFAPIDTIDYAGVKAFVSRFNRWACECISTEGGITFEDTKSKILELLAI